MPSIVLFGDSITQGAWSAGDGPGAFRAPFNQSIITKSFIYSTVTFLQQSNSLSSNTLSRVHPPFIAPSLRVGCNARRTVCPAC